MILCSNALYVLLMSTRAMYLSHLLFIALCPARPRFRQQLRKADDDWPDTSQWRNAQRDKISKVVPHPNDIPLQRWDKSEYEQWAVLTACSAWLCLALGACRAALAATQSDE
ncbi:hypothetical protein CLAIMM_08508 [Cladophialophora immunda]|nr:hypothetical protein CLAIMM_08508 [Cladophialophora immunda]